MKLVVVTGIQRTELDTVDGIAEHGVATAHEANGRRGYLGPALRPIQSGVRIGGTAVTALCQPSDNLMMHAAVEQCAPGDILVVTTTSPCTDGMFGELMATALVTRGVRGLVIEGGVRDVAELRELGFPVWSTAVSAQGTEKSAAGAVNVPITVSGQVVRPGDAIIADDDGVVCVPRAEAGQVLAAARARVTREQTAREAYRAGELSLDRYDLRSTLESQGVRYLTAEEYGL